MISFEHKFTEGYGAKVEIEDEIVSITAISDNFGYEDTTTMKLTAQELQQLIRSLTYALESL